MTNKKKKIRRKRSEKDESKERIERAIVKEYHELIEEQKMEAIS